MIVDTDYRQQKQGPGAVGPSKPKGGRAQQLNASNKAGDQANEDKQLDSDPPATNQNAQIPQENTQQDPGPGEQRQEETQ